MLRYAMEDISEGRQLLVSAYYVSDAMGSPIKLFVGLPVRSTGRTAAGPGGVMGMSLVVRIVPQDVIDVWGEDFWEKYKRLSAPIDLDYDVTLPVPFDILSPTSWGEEEPDV